MRAILDADSIIYASCFNVETFEEVKEKFTAYLDSILSDLSDFCDVDDIWICNGSRNNFRVALNSSYKANRTQDKPNFLPELHHWVKKEYKSYFADGYETDDVVATLWMQSVDELGEGNVVIVANDKDYKQFPCWYFDLYYKRRELSKISEKDAIKNFYTQMIVGDTADNVNYCKGFGLKYAKNLFKDSETEFSHIRRTYTVFKIIYGDEAKEKFMECYNLLKLRTDVKQIESV